MARVTVAELKQFVNTNNNYDFASEFKLLPPSNIKTSIVGAINANKNRYENIRPFDDNLVKLNSSKYINASYITCYPNINERFIVCQAPIISTMDDHWEMVLQHKVHVIVMLTPVIKNKSDRYWPINVGDSDIYGQVIVTLQRIEMYREYTCHHLAIYPANDRNNVQYVEHVMFISWKDKSLPKDTFSLLAFMNMVANRVGDSKNPIVVHCSAGAGRSGTFTAIWNLIEEAKIENSVFVFKTIEKMRQQRMCLVETEEQYEFIYLCVLDSFINNQSEYDFEHCLSKSSCINFNISKIFEVKDD